MHYQYDLHTHSHCSDGSLSPTELVTLAKANGVKVLALTDHDTLEGIEEAQAAAGDDLEIVPGIELSCRWGSYTIHVVGLWVDVEDAGLQSAVAQQLAARQNRAQEIARRLEKAGIAKAWEGASHYAKGEIGRPHFAQYLVDSGYVDSINQAFKRYLGAGKVGDVKHHWPAVSTVVEWINAAGGVAILAHPDKYDLTRTKLYALLAEFVAAGGRGIEVVSGIQDAGVTTRLRQAAVDFELLASCGSDFHSPENAWQSPGKMTPLPVECQPVWAQRPDSLSATAVCPGK